MIRFSPSPYGCTHGYYIPCSQCPKEIREKYNKNPESFPVYIRDEHGNILGIDRWQEAKAP